MKVEGQTIDLSHNTCTTTGYMRTQQVAAIVTVRARLSGSPVTPCSSADRESFGEPQSRHSRWSGITSCSRLSLLRTLWIQDEGFCLEHNAVDILATADPTVEYIRSKQLFFNRMPRTIWGSRLIKNTHLRFGLRCLYF